VNTFPKNFPNMDLGTALAVSTSQAATAEECADALSTLRDFYVRAAGIDQAARLSIEGREGQASIRVMRFPNDIEGADYATALLLLADGRRLGVASGRASVHTDPDGNCIWGYDSALRPHVIARGLDVAAAKLALKWLSDESNPPLAAASNQDGH
jgi:hypothetical protein